MSAELSVEQLRKVYTTGHPPVQQAAIETVTFPREAEEIDVMIGPSG